jgi:hypothetical protein
MVPIALMLMNVLETKTIATQMLPVQIHMAPLFVIVTQATQATERIVLI